MPWPVYPRVGGGTATDETEPQPEHGLSPRGRGNRDQALIDQSRERSIPAWAGEPVVPHPLLLTGNGLSPRGRGNR